MSRWKGRQLERPPDSSMPPSERWQQSVGWDRICVSSVLVLCSEGWGRAEQAGGSSSSLAPCTFTCPRDYRSPHRQGIPSVGVLCPAKQLFLGM